MIGPVVLAVLVALRAPAVTIPIGGAVVRSGAVLDVAAWGRLPHMSASAVDHDGHAGVYEGVRMSDVLRDSGAPVGDAVRGAAARTYVVVLAADGYQVVFALAELDQVEARCAPLLPRLSTDRRYRRRLARSKLSLRAIGRTRAGSAT